MVDRDGQPAEQQPEEQPERPFPSEAEWLDLAMPNEAELSGIPSRDFVDRIASAVTEEAQLDRELAQLAREVPPALLLAHTAPEPSATFVARTVAAIHVDRLARWQHLLARHVAPEPSPQFVELTLSALAAGREPVTAPAAPRRWWRLKARPLWLLAAAVALVFLLVRGEAQPGFELRLARSSSPAFAHAFGSSPVAALVVHRAHLLEPDALSSAGADGLWLTLAEGR